MISTQEFFQNTNKCANCKKSISEGQKYCFSCNKLKKTDNRTLKEHNEQTEKTLPTLMGDAVLIDPLLQKEAIEQINNQVFIMTDPEISKGMDPVHIVDISKEENKQIKKTVRQWMNPNILKHKIDILEIFPNWIIQIKEIKGKRITLLSPIVTLDQELVFDPLEQTITWLKEHDINGLPEAIVVIPKKWIDSNGPEGYAGTEGKSIFLAYESLEDNGLSGFRNVPRHEMNHSAIIADKTMGYSYSRSMTEGIDMTLEILQSGEDPGEYLRYLARNFKSKNPDINKIHGFSAEKTHKKNNIKSEYNPKKIRRGTEYFQGVVMCYLIYINEGLDGLKNVYKRTTTKPLINEEFQLKRAIKKGLNMTKKDFDVFEQQYLNFINRLIEIV